MCNYHYYDAANHALDFDGMVKSPEEAVQACNVVLFQGCCHNPERYRSNGAAVASAG
ncbi:MAG: hypothetical protein ACR5LD_03050 [Symbiopectobacterium sp.]